MKTLTFWMLLLNFFSPASCQHSPAAMPTDFSVTIDERGGLTQLSSRIIISLDSCIKEEKRGDTLVSRVEWKATKAELESLYQSLLKLGSFGIRWLAYHGKFYDAGSRFISFMVNGKNYRVHSSVSSRIVYKDLDKYHETVRLLKAFESSSNQKDQKRK